MAGSLDLVQFDRVFFDANCSEERVTDIFAIDHGGVRLGSLHRPYDATELVVKAFGKSYQLDLCELSEVQWRDVLEQAKQLTSEAPERIADFVTLLTRVLESFDFQRNTLTFYFCH